MAGNYPDDMTEVRIAEMLHDNVCFRCNRAKSRCLCDNPDSDLECDIQRLNETDNTKES